MKKAKKLHTKLFSFKNLREVFIFRIQDETHLNDRFYVKVSKRRMFFLLFLIILLLVGGTFYIMTFTSARKYIPGYTDPQLNQKLYILEQRTDSLLYQARLKDQYILNIQSILTGQITPDFQDSSYYKKVDHQLIVFQKSIEDSLLRMEMEQIEQYTLPTTDVRKSSIQNFKIPVFGYITNRFSIVNHTYGIDFSANPDAPIFATYDGTVVYSDWTPETGHTIIIQHVNNFISVYKYNASRLKQSGDFVKAGAVIAYIGNSGELSTEPHLHFELWHNGVPVDPELYLRFE